MVSNPAASPAHSRRTVRRIFSPYNWVLRLSPVKSFLIAWAVGLALVAFSIAVGVGYFHAHILLSVQGAALPPLEIALGYLEQLNYGPWIAIPLCCPFVFALCSFLYKCSKSLTPPHLRAFCSLEHLSEKPLVSVAGLFLFLAFVGKSVVVEIHDYGHLGLGWVQAESLESESARALFQKAPVRIDRTFRSFNIHGQQIEANKVELFGVSPATFHVRGHRRFLAFIVVAKIWAGAWEGLVVYMTLLLALWGHGVIRAVELKAANRKKVGLAKLGIGWAQPVILAVIFLGLEVNLFSISRYLANVAKGSFGSWDQYWSLLILTPPIAVLGTAVGVAAKVFYKRPVILESLVSRLDIALWGAWGSTYAVLVHLVLGFADPPTNAVVSAIASAMTKHKP